MSSTSLPSLPPLSTPPTSSVSPGPQISSAQRTAEARAAFVASLQAVGQSLDNDLQSRAKNIHENAKVLSEQEKTLAKSTKQLQKDAAQLEKFVEKSNKGGKGAMSEFDDLEGLLGNLEGELDMLERTLGIVEDDIDEQEEGATVEEVTRGEEGSETNHESIKGAEHCENSGNSITSKRDGKRPET